MAHKVTVQLLDDLDGTAADETVRFGLDGKSYEIDLSADNAETMRKGLEDFIKAARRQGGVKRRAAGHAAVSGARRPSGAEVREWAAAQGIEVAARGRVSSDVVEQYQQAHSG